MKKPIEYLSFGAGPPSLALAILNIWGEVQPRAELVMWADTGWEKKETYRLLPVYENWIVEMGMEFVNVQAAEGPLQDYIRAKSIPIRVHTANAIGKRQCTDKWKIAPIEKYLHGRFGRDVPLIAQLGLTYDEGHRMKDPRVKRNKNRWPLIEKKLTRDMTIEIIELAGLPVPPWSACLGCPLQNDGRWRVIAGEHSEDFQKAVELDTFLRERARANGKGDVWLHWSRRPLGNIYSADQMPLPLDYDPTGGGCESSSCFT